MPPSNLEKVLRDNIATLREVALNNMHSTLTTGMISVNKLTSLRLYCGIDGDILSDILAHGHHLETLHLYCYVRNENAATLSSAFRSQLTQGPGALRMLQDFGFSTVVTRNYYDPDLFPAVIAFVREHPWLRALALSNLHNSSRQVGYDAAVWGVLPTLRDLRALYIEFPSGLSPELSTRLIPRSVTALRLQLPYGRDSLRLWTVSSLRFVHGPILCLFWTSSMTHTLFLGSVVWNASWAHTPWIPTHTIIIYGDTGGHWHDLSQAPHRGIIISVLYCPAYRGRD
jgi:hypothetical protein